MQDQLVLNGRYKLLERIGSGGMSIVFKAQDLLLGRLVAVKMLHASLTGDEGFLHRFRQEAHAAANLTHPNIVTIHDIGQDGDRHYMVMEHVDGRTLKQIIRSYNHKGQFMPIDRALDLTIQICHGIGYAHRAGLVHCDVKPQNVLVTRDDRVKVADFGIARAISEASQHYHDSEIWGTPQYFAPEQASGQTATPASDVYAIGVILFELLSGQLPFTAESHTALALKHLQAEPPLIGEYNPAVPLQLEQIIDKVLSKEASGRYRTAGQFGRILSAYRTSSNANTGPLELAVAPISEQKTQIYAQPTLPRPPTPPPATGRSARPAPVQAAPIPETDWLAIGLGIAALLALLGLIPLWYYVYLVYAG